MPRLRHADCASRGWTRRRAGRGFAYYDACGQRITDPDALARIRSLVIPPAWTGVWICPWPNGHIQAVGTDAAGRRQYRYHDYWRLRRDQEKFDQMLDFARALPALRARMAEDLTEPGPTRNRVLATAVRLLDHGLFRIGGEDYAEEHESYGLATLRKEHVRVSGDEVVFDFTAKSGKHQHFRILEPEVAAVIGSLKRRRGGSAELLAYRHRGVWYDVKSADINAYIKSATGQEFSAKAFRTWHATVLAAQALAMSDIAPVSARARRRAVAFAVQQVARRLGNTPSVSRKSYVDPRVIDRYYAGVTVKDAAVDLGDVAPGEMATHGRLETAVLDLLEEAPTPQLATAG